MASSAQLLPFTPIVMKLHVHKPYRLRMCPINFGSKGQGLSTFCTLITKNGFQHITTSPLQILSWNFTHRLRWNEGYVPYWLCGLKVKVTVRCLWKMLSFPFKVVMKLHTQTPNESRMCPFQFRWSKVEVTVSWLGNMASRAYLLSGS